MPAAPANLDATARAGSVTLRWTDNAGNKRAFRVERCAQSNCTTFALAGETAANVTTFMDTTVVRGTTYRYRVRARNDAGDSANSNIDSMRAK